MNDSNRVCLKHSGREADYSRKVSFRLRTGQRDVLKLQPNRSNKRVSVPYLYVEAFCVHAGVSGNVPEPLTEVKSQGFSLTVCGASHALTHYEGGDVNEAL